jgi:hypothetical protein
VLHDIEPLNVLDGSDGTKEFCCVVHDIEPFNVLGGSDGTTFCGGKF